jgi:hypothetical protein
MTPGFLAVSTCLKDGRDERYERWAKGEQNGHNQAKRCLREGSRCRSTDRRSNAETHEQDRVESRAPEIDGTSTEVRGENPGKHDENGLQSGGNQAKRKRKFSVNSGLCGCVSVMLYQVDGRSWVLEIMDGLGKFGSPSNANRSIFLAPLERMGTLTSEEVDSLCGFVSVTFYQEDGSGSILRLAIRLPVRFWAAYTPHTMRVR